MNKALFLLNILAVIICAVATIVHVLNGKLMWAIIMLILLGLNFWSAYNNVNNKM